MQHAAFFISRRGGGPWHVAHLTAPLPAHPDQAVFLGDILATAWYGCELGEVGPGDAVAIWGAGPGEALAGGARCPAAAQPPAVRAAV
jgi:D-arabinose 1-dehydrogenase-like Zn-dependent alcohol dehydrogenase